MKKQVDIQSIIDQIRSKALSEQELIDLLGDARLLIVANVLIVLPSLRLTRAQSVVDAVMNVATGGQSSKVLLGNITLRKLAAASLQAMSDEEAQNAFQALTATFSEQELNDLQWFIESNQLQAGEHTSEPRQ
jgi:hypothetical protein